jgi:hypothetical protein
MKDPVRRLKRYIGNRVRETFNGRGNRKNGGTFKHLPYTPEELKLHLESLWESWMNWDNYGGNMADNRMTWHIDHIIPVANFEFNSMQDDEFSQCWALSNLRPLEKIANCKKRCRVE